MPYLTNLAAVARRTGFPVVEQPGWKTRGHGPMSSVRSVVCHHDAARQSPTTFNTVIQNGRSGLPGPLAQFALRRDGTIHVVAAGLAYHAGRVTDYGLYGNSHAIGIEAGNDGLGEPWPARQLRAYYALCAELCKEFGIPVSRVRGHKEVAAPIGRKPDPRGINMSSFRAAVSRATEDDGLSSYSSADLTLYAYRGTVTAWQDAAYHPESHSAKAVRAAVAPILAPVRGEVAGLAELVKQLSNNESLDLEAVRKAAEQGTKAALEEGVVQVDVSVSGKETENA